MTLNREKCCDFILRHSVDKAERLHENIEALQYTVERYFLGKNRESFRRKL